MKQLKLFNISIIGLFFCLILSCGGGAGVTAVSPPGSGGGPQAQQLGGGSGVGDFNKISDPQLASTAHAAPGADSTVVAPGPDWIPSWVLVMQCNVASCAVIGIDPDLLSSSKNEDSYDERVCYKFIGRMAPGLTPDANYPGLDGIIVRFVDTEHQKYADFKTEEIQGMHGSFFAKLTVDTTPHVVYYKAPPEFVPPTLGVMKNCNGSCVPADWDNIKPLYPNNSCDFLQSPDDSRQRSGGSSDGGTPGFKLQN